MLDAKSLELLQSLKTEINANKTVFKGKIKGTGRNFGFVVSEDDSSEHFLPPDQMSKVFPGDDVTFIVEEQDDGKSRAVLETLEHSNLSSFKGIFYIRGKAQGVEPFSEAFNGWLFTPPKHSLEAAHNEIVIAKVTRHPWKTGKAQCEVVQTLGLADNNRTWYSLSLEEHNIPEAFTEEEMTAAESIANADLPVTQSHVDLTDIPFVTIDSASTQDMDDALFAETTEKGWNLKVAIADASSFIESNSILDAAAKERLTTTYLPGLVLPMLPVSLSNDLLSLVEKQNRLALVFNIQVAQDGSSKLDSIQQAIVNNHGKLNYPEVSEWLAGESYPEEHKENLTALNDVSKALFAWRQSQHNTMQDRVDYRIRVDDNFNVSGIEKEERVRARDIVEESMIVTNVLVADYLKDNPALFMSHKGFKPDRETELKGLLRDYAPDISELDGYTLDGFIQILTGAKNTENFPLQQVLQKRFDRGYWSSQPEPHFGLGFNQYTTATSPIRKYTDLVIHRLIKATLNGSKLDVSADMVEDINNRNANARFVANAIDQRLRAQWIADQPKQAWAARIVHLNANGLVVQLEDNGVSGFIDLRKKKSEFSYDPLRMMLKFEEFDYMLGQSLSVQVSKIEQSGIQFALS